MTKIDADHGGKAKGKGFCQLAGRDELLDAATMITSERTMWQGPGRGQGGDDLIPAEAWPTGTAQISRHK